MLVMMPPSWKTEIEETVEKAGHSSSERQRADNEKNAADISAAIESFVSAYNTQHNKPERKDKIKRFLEVAGFVLLVGTFVFTGLSYLVFHDQLRASIDNEQRSLRAYVGIDGEKIVVNCALCDDPKKVRPNDHYSDANAITLLIHNYGQTPAFDGLGVVGTKAMPVGQDLDSKFDYPLPTNVTSYRWFVEPHETTGFGAELDDAAVELVKKARDRKIWLFFYGEMNYLDAFNCAAKVLFCFRYAPDNSEEHRFPACHEHNEPAKKCEKQELQKKASWWSLLQ